VLKSQIPLEGAKSRLRRALDKGKDKTLHTKVKHVGFELVEQLQAANRSVGGNFLRSLYVSIEGRTDDDNEPSVCAVFAIDDAITLYEGDMWSARISELSSHVRSPGSNSSDCCLPLATPHSKSVVLRGCTC
jgi:hypothetical protein